VAGKEVILSKWLCSVTLLFFATLKWLCFITILLIAGRNPRGFDNLKLSKGQMWTSAAHKKWLCFVTVLFLACRARQAPSPARPFPKMALFRHFCTFYITSMVILCAVRSPNLTVVFVGFFPSVRTRPTSPKWLYSVIFLLFPIISPSVRQPIYK